MSRSTLGILTKFWQPGRVKTRLGASIGMRQAAALHRLFVTHLCQVLADSADRRVVCLDPPDSVADFGRELESLELTRQWKVTEQGQGPLGARIKNWFMDELATADTASAVLIGGDCPTLGPSEIDQAIGLLADHQVVLGPATDGGYVLIGLSGPWRTGEQGYTQLFDEIPWSTDSVLETTRERLRQSGLAFAELPVMSDVDTHDDLDRLLQRLSNDDTMHLFQQIKALLAGSTDCEDDS